MIPPTAPLEPLAGLGINVTLAKPARDEAADEQLAGMLARALGVDVCHACRICRACLSGIHSCCFPVACANGPDRHDCACHVCAPRRAA